MISKAALKNLIDHIEAERRQDLDAMIAPLSDRARYVIQDSVFEGREAIRAMYAAGLDKLTDANMDEYQRALDDPSVTSWGERHCVIEYSDDYPLHRNMVVVVHFDEDDKLVSENTYWRGPNRLAVPFAKLS
jgi:hypothetical protein